MPHADVGRPRVLQFPVEQGFIGLVQGAGRLVENGIGGFGQEQTGEGQALLLDLAFLAFLAPEEGDRFGVVPDVHQTVA